MPTTLRVGPYRFYFFSHETTEPAHTHIDRDDDTAKFWLQPVSLASSSGFKPNELRKLQALVMEHQEKLKEAWYGYFGSTRG